MACAVPLKSPDTSHLIPPPPFGLAANNSTTRRSRSSSKVNACTHIEPTQMAQSRGHFLAQNAILKPMTGRDIVALIFILLMLPQGISCLVLTGYILLGSFKSMVGKTVAKFILLSENLTEYELEARPTSKYRYYRSELVGDMLQLFSINSFILLVCHYTLPKSWLQCLVVLAKSIVASRLVGSYTMGSTTYVSVVSATSSTTTTTTTTSGQVLQQTQSGGKNDIKYSTNNFFNSLLGFFSVIALNNFILNWVLRLNFPLLLNDLGSFYRNLAAGNDNREVTLESVLKALFTKSPFFVSFNYLSAKKGSYIIDSRKLFGKSNLISKFIIHVSINYLNLGGKSIQSISFILRESSIVINYAYLVLCIHVISLTISPFLQRIFIFKDYSKTLDHLSSLTPDVPYGGFKKNGLITNLPRETASDSVVVINVDLLLLQLQRQSTPLELKVNLEISKSKFTPNVTSDSNLVPSSNFKIFCLVPSTNKSLALGGKSNHSRTIVDNRKRLNSNATPSTTIMDKYFTISIQPIWSWLAAIKVLMVAPSLFGGSPTRTKNNGSRFFTEAVEPVLPLAVAHIGESKVIFEILDRDYFDQIYQRGFSIRVNDTNWLYVSLLVGQPDSDGKEQFYLSIEGLAPVYQYEIDFYAESLIVGHHVVITTSNDRAIVTQSLELSSIDSLQYSLKYHIESYNELKACLKKAKRDESKRVSDLKKQIESLRTKIDKFGGKHITEGKIGGKLRGLQNSVTQLENEIKDLRKQITHLDRSNGHVQEDYKDEETKLNQEIFELEAYISEFEANTAKLRNDLKGALGDKDFTDAKRKKLTDKLDSRREDITRLNGEIRALKKVLFTKFQKRQKRINDRFDVIIPKIDEACETLSRELEVYMSKTDSDA